jgi:hypothetical protein
MVCLSLVQANLSRILIEAIFVLSPSVFKGMYTFMIDLSSSPSSHQVMSHQIHQWWMVAKRFYQNCLLYQLYLPITFSTFCYLLSSCQLQTEDCPTVLSSYLAPSPSWFDSITIIEMVTQAI